MKINKEMSLAHFKLKLQFDSDECLSNLQNFQRDWLVNKFMNESIRDLEQIDELAKRFVHGTERPELPENWSEQEVHYDDSQLLLKGHQVMQAWEHRIMKAMAKVATETHGDILEVGFGMGISASCIQDYGVRSYTVIEPNKSVIQAFEKWRQNYPSSKMRLLDCNWQDANKHFERYDGVLFDPYFVADSGSVEVESSTAVGNFLPLIMPHIREGGVMTYFSREIDSLSRAHQRMLFNYFRLVEIKKITDLVPPDDCNYWWADSMMVVKAVK